MLLFPTLTHLRDSRSGKRLQLLMSLPLVGPRVHRLAAALLFLWPTWARRWLLERILGFPPHAAATTVSFLGSRDGVWQALHLARDELQRINHDVWPEDVWQVTSEPGARRSPHPKIFMLYGEDDHWVANRHRDDLIMRRVEQPDCGRAGQRGARIVVDDAGLPHAFCFRMSTA